MTLRDHRKLTIFYALVGAFLVLAGIALPLGVLSAYTPELRTLSPEMIERISSTTDINELRKLALAVASSDSRLVAIMNSAMPGMSQVVGVVLMLSGSLLISAARTLSRPLSS